MSSLIPFGSSGQLLSTRVERQLARVQADALVAAARQSAKVEVLETVSEAALLATSRLAHLERVLVAQTPHAMGRLQLIAEAAALGMYGVVQQSARKVL